MDHLLNDESLDDATDVVVIKNETVHVTEALVTASQTLPYLANSVIHSDHSAASLGLHILSASAATPSVLMSVPKPPPRLPPISLLTAAAAALQPMQCNPLQTPALPSPPQSRVLHLRMTPLQAVRQASSAPSSSFLVPPPCSDLLQADDILCRYRNKKCGYPRAIKRNGERHNLCERHRAKANQNQRKLESKRRVKKRMMQRVADRVVNVKRMAASPNREIKFTLYGTTLA
ncbi:unnamed protein product [Peronospora belbahrii]|uniref:BZIP domain-containing protein n=1 Tax=Peronospora belbahrii TaxID=622444 RepID=A0AAU9KP83_9STRA|nr:unnamed protein product [Peronospora belbahrii]CAH0515666.1 unnamed protein product [Peronospora belbahrii]